MKIKKILSVVLFFVVIAFLGYFVFVGVILK